MSRWSLRIAVAAPLVVVAMPLAAQEAADTQNALEAQTGEPPLTIDILAAREEAEDEIYEDCEEDQDAAILTGEIVVCRKRSGDENRLYDKEAAERRHAERTMNHNDPQAPDVFGIPNHGTVVARGCFIPPCPPPPAYMIDFDELPDTPKGSDADRIARGLAPRGLSANPDGSVTVAAEPGLQGNAEELGLPEPLNPSGSASPAEEPSG